MRKKREYRRGNPLVVLVILATLLGGLYYLNEIYEPGPPAGRSRQGDFELLSGGRLIEDANRNDGDSFRIRHGKDEYIFRLYFVDCPEKRVHSYDRDRIADQGQYFGGLGESQTIALGNRAKAFTLRLLRKEPFEILTKWEEVYSSGRFYALVRFTNPETNDNPHLHEHLVINGLARIYTRGVDFPGRGVLIKYQDYASWSPLPGLIGEADGRTSIEP